VRVGVTLRNMGVESTRAMMADCTRVAEDHGIESIWITDHVAIPPDDAEGSGGRYVDPFITLSWLAGLTSNIKLGVGVIVLPYRPPLMFARQVAALQELSTNRLLLGVGVGWMEAEFRAVGADLHRRARDSDSTLEFLNRCFANDVVEANGQPFLFKPRPPKPPVLVGGRPPHALERAARYGDGWLPMGLKPGDVATQRDRYRQLTDRFGRPPGSITAMAGLPLRDHAAALDALNAYRAAGIDRLICGIRYRTYTEYATEIAALAAVCAR
jgi:probable F420-dependent oxidoreductase